MTDAELAKHQEALDKLGYRIVHTTEVGIRGGAIGPVVVLFLLVGLSLGTAYVFDIPPPDGMTWGFGAGAPDTCQ